MNLLFRALTPFITILLVAGCGGQATLGGSGDGAGAGGGTAGGGGTDLTPDPDVPPECRVETAVAGPYEVRFRFINPTSDSLYIRERSDRPEFVITACADGYAAEIPQQRYCVHACSPELSLYCEVCPDPWDEVVFIHPGEVVEQVWRASAFYDSSMEGCFCHEVEPLPAAKYRLTVKAANSYQGAFEPTMGFVVEQDFDVPVPSGVVDVVLEEPVER